MSAADINKPPKPAKPTPDALTRVHVTSESVASKTLTPPHPPREDTPKYRAAHLRLIETLDTPCYICGSREQRETHHRLIERSLADACDWRKVAHDFPIVTDHASLLDWVDSEDNLLVLCATHHRDPEHGIHHLVGPDFYVQRYLKNGYVIAATAADVQQALQQDEAIETADGDVTTSDQSPPALSSASPPHTPAPGERTSGSGQ